MEHQILSMLCMVYKIKIGIAIEKIALSMLCMVYKWVYTFVFDKISIIHAMHGFLIFKLFT